MKLHEGGPVWPESKNHGVGMKWSAKTSHKGRINQHDDDIPRISNLLDDVGMEIYPILMPGSKTDRVARQCPKSTKFVVEV